MTPCCPFRQSASLRSLPRRTVSRLAREDYGVIFVEERQFVAQAALIDRLVQEFSASIIPIPGIRGSIGVGLSAVRSSVERAVGMDIFSEK